MLRKTSLRLPARQANRSLYTQACTFYSPSPQFLQAHLAQQTKKPDSTSVFLLSTSLPDLPQHLSVLQKHLPSYIGSFSIAPPDHEPTISLATFSDGELRVFRSELTGRPPAEVGRFQRPEQQRTKRAEDLKGLGQGEVEDALIGQGWAGLWRSENPVQRIPDLEDVNADSVLLLTDGRPGPVLSALDAMYPQASKSGILTAATPFITNRPHTLLHNGNIYDSGTLGLALASSSRSQVDFGLVTMTDPVQISGAQGNMLLSIEGTNSNPTQMLIAAIQRRGGTGITKEEDFFLGFLENGSVKKVVKILSGDPSRGALSVDMEEPLLPGQTVQFMHRQPASPIVKPTPHTFTFSSLAKSEETDDIPIGQPRVVKGFLGLSEGGFIYSNPSSSICTAPGATNTVHW
ncbi:hypothetical protein I317_03928 [Kwoniella heveanensis CBS 569]|uniref:FIST domain-containing protein n=1 Tax=Kwoniella heveanensis BCC8398 TaxID=1296120 RepID=A0A1B9H3W9_9TREE|nr:hypothetical protein I316_00191 [Kwoniella heveanensis BCC8398]OCF42193.1 hypothetical protein I317_03928 [Kwoniella heveanensis CBS 569]